MSSLRSGMRPMSAKAPSHHRQLIAKTFNNKSNNGSVDNVAKIWTAFGKYVSKTLKSGKGVAIPKFGQFTFTPMQVDLAGATNPDKRDKQIREPIFQIAKDFAPGMAIKPGVVHDNGAIRPFEVKGSSGIVPKVRVNFTEIGYYAGVSKEDAKHGCDIVVRDLSDKVKSGQPTKLMIPNVGSFICRGRIAGIKFDSDVVQESKGKTSKAYFVGKLFASSVNRANLDVLDQKVSQGIRSRPANYSKTNQRIPVLAKHDSSIAVTDGANNWLKKNLGVTLEGGEPSEYNPYKSSGRKMKRTFSARPGFRSDVSECSTVRSDVIPDRFQTKTLEQASEKSERAFNIRSSSKKRRPMSAYSGASRMSKASSVRSIASHVPKIARAVALDYCHKIATKAVLDYVKTTKLSARDKLNPTEIMNILTRSGIGIDIATTRGLLNHMNFPAHGKSCSILDLIRRCKQWSAATTAVGNTAVLPKVQPSSIYSMEELIAKARDCFYKSGKDIKQIFNAGADDNGAIDEEAFVFICKKYCHPEINEEEARIIFRGVYRNLGTNMYFNDFRNIFGSIAPKSNFHIEGLKHFRDWMYKNGLTSENAFDALSHGRDAISISEFETEIKRLFNWTAPEIEALFKELDQNNDGFIDREEWLDKVYEDSSNPLQLLREIINAHNLDSDDLLFKMNLRIWDDPLDYQKFAKALRILDSSLTDVQLRAMAKSLKNSKNLVEVPVLVRNLVGKDYETVDFRDKLYKRLYNEIFENNSAAKQEKLRNLLVKYDDLNDGTIVAQDLQKTLKEVCKNVRPSDIDKFTRFLEKDVRGRIDYTQFITKLEEVKEHNPFKALVSRIKAFMTQNNQSVDSFMRRLVMSEANTDTKGMEENGLEKERKVSVNFFAKFLKNKVDKKRKLEELKSYTELIDIDNDGYISIYDLNSCLGNLNNETFYKDNGATLVGSFKTILTEREKFFPKDPLPDDKALDVITKIKDALVAKGISFRELFNRLDSNNDEFVTFTEFSDNLDPIVKLSPLIKQQLFALMDVNKIGMVDYQAFLETMKKTPVAPKIIRVADNFDWEYKMVQKIKDWIREEGITIEEAFKAFDRDFDGYIDLDDLKWILTHILKVGDKSSINTSQLERLFKLLDFHKSGHIQKCDIQRLVENDNPYLSTGKLTNAKFMVGADTFDWKNNAIQQIGIELSKNKNYSTLKD